MSIFTSAKKRHFKEKLHNIQRQIWDREFQKFQALEMREMIRLDRDRALEASDAFRVELEREHTENTKKELEAKKKHADDNANRFTAQLKMIDNEVNGIPYAPPIASYTNDKGEIVPEQPERAGQQGLNDTIASLGEVRKMYTAYLKTL